MKLTAIVILIYGVITLVGGIMGYVKAQSGMSLLTGGVSGLILIIAAYLIHSGNFAGIYISLLISLGLSIFFGIRFSQSWSLMPAGLMLFLSLIALGFSIYGLSFRSNIAV